MMIVSESFVVVVLPAVIHIICRPMYYLRSIAPNSRSYQPVKIDRNLDASAQRMSERSTEFGKWRSRQESYVFTVNLMYLPIGNS